MEKTITKAVHDSLRHNIRKKALQALSDLAEEITEDFAAFGVFRPHGEDSLLLEKLGDILQLLEECYPELPE